MQLDKELKRVHEQGADYEPARRSRAHQPARFPKVAVSTRAPRVAAARGPLDRLARAHQEGRPRSRREIRALLPPGLCLLAPMRGCEMTVWSLLTGRSLQCASQRGPPGVVCRSSLSARAQCWGREHDSAVRSVKNRLLEGENEYQELLKTLVNSSEHARSVFQSRSICNAMQTSLLNYE